LFSEKAIYVLQEVLRDHGLINMETDGVTMETDAECQSDQSDDSKRQIQLPLDFVQLWPLFEYSSILGSWRMLDDLCVTQSDNERAQSLVDYAAQFTPMSPTDLSFLMNMINEKEV
jgi:hypothetical protein